MDMALTILCSQRMFSNVCGLVRLVKCVSINCERMLDASMKFAWHNIFEL